MTFRDVLLYLAPVLPALTTGLWYWYKWRQEGHKGRGRLSVGLVAVSVVVAWMLLYFVGEDKKAQLTQARDDAARQAEHAGRVESQLQDLSARVVAADQRLQILTEGIPDPKLKKEAEAIRTELQRGVVERLHTDATVTAEVSRAQKTVLPRYWPFFFWSIAVIFSFFYGISAVRIFVSQEQRKSDRTWRFHQAWFNFTGAFAGWSALYLLVVRLEPHYPNSLTQLTFLDLMIFLIAFIGITGHLPFTIMGLIHSLADLFAKGLEKISK